MWRRCVLLRWRPSSTFVLATINRVTHHLFALFICLLLHPTSHTITSIFHHNVLPFRLYTSHMLLTEIVVRKLETRQAWQLANILRHTPRQLVPGNIQNVNLLEARKVCGQATHERVLANIENSNIAKQSNFLRETTTEVIV